MFSEIMACSRPFYNPDIVDFNGDPIPIPCGSCFCCRLDIQKAAIDRMFCAWKCHSVSAFVTFTYDDEHLIFQDGFRQPTLSKDDLHKYLDNIRHLLHKVKFEYYACGEYGDKFNRPHYHVLFFGLDYQLHKSFFEQSWKKGSVKVLPVQSGSFRYVAKYLSKPYSKEYNDIQYYDIGLIPPFRKMSRGLGVKVYLDHLDEIRDNGFFVFCGRRISVSRYYFNKLLAYNDRLVLAREKSIDDNRRRLSEDAKRFNLSDSYYRHFRVEQKEKVLQSQHLNQNSSYF